jgi:hypothetical protein
VSTVSGRRLLSTFPDVTVHSMSPAIPDPYLNSVLELRGRWNSGPVVAQINAGMYDLIVIGKGKAEAHKGDGYRGVRSWDDGMWGALRRTYGLACVFEGMEVWLPNRGSGEILPSLSGIGCLAVAREADSGSAVGQSDPVVCSTEGANVNRPARQQQRFCSLIHGTRSTDR